MKRLLKRPRRMVRELLRRQTYGSRRGPLIVNEAVVFPMEAIFISVPKTGTSSVRIQLRQDGRPVIPHPHLDIIQVRDAIYAYLLRSSLGKNKRYPSEGVPTDAELRVRARNIFDSFFKFSSVRNPWARAVSLYFRREGVQKGDWPSFEAFCEKHHYASDTCRQPTLHRNQLDWLVDEDGRFVMDYVYKVEDFAAAVNEIRERTDGRICLEYREANRNRKSRSQAYRDIHTDRTRKLIAQRFEKDIDFFKYTF